MKLDKKGSTDEDSGSERSSSFGKVKMPKMPYFGETKDCMDSYLNRFERFAEAQAWKKDSIAIYLSALLKGKALDVYSRLPPDQANDYGTLKQALLKRYQLSEDGFKRKFRTARAEVGESPTQFITRLASYLQRWIELANVQQTYEGLITLVIREQYLSVCSPELALFLKERAITDLEELGKLAEQYSEAHNEAVTFKKNSSEGRFMKPREVTHNVKKCYKCGSNSHLMKDCRSVTRETRPQATSPQNQRSCFICGKTGHIARNCFQRSKAAAMESDEPDANVPPQTNSPRRQTATDCTRCTVAQSHSCSALLAPEVELKCGCKLPVIADACRTGHKYGSGCMPVKDGSFREKHVSVLRDTGCSTVVVRRSLVPEDMLTGEKATCVLIDGTVRRTPVENIDIRTPYFSGTVRALCMERPLYDIIIRNVEGVKDTEDADAVQLSDDVKTQQDQDILKEGQAVVTRSQSKSRVTKPLSVAEAIDTTISTESIAKLQAEGASLKKILDKLQQKTGSEDSKETEFFVDKTLLYRHDPNEQQRCTSRSKAKQLVLPETLRLRVMKVAHESTMSGHQAIARTLDRLSAQFWWPGVTGDVQRFCKSCDICQRTIAKGRKCTPDRHAV